MIISFIYLIKMFLFAKAKAFFQFSYLNFNLVHCTRKKLLDFHYSWKSLLFPILKVQFSVIKSVISIFQKEFFFKRAIFEYFPLIFKLRNSRVIENIFPGKIGHDLCKFNYFQKIDKKVW